MRQIILLLTITILTTGLFAGEWHVKSDAKNEVRFTSEVVVLSFDGVTNQIDGYLYWEGDKFLEKKAQLQFDVNLNSIETGIGKRDRDMRETLKTDEWPTTTFKSSNIQMSKIDSSVTAYKIMAKGTMFIHGVEKELKVPGIITLDGEKMHVMAKFSVLLADYDIEAPSIAAFVKVSQEIKLKLNFFMKEASAE